MHQRKYSVRRGCKLLGLSQSVYRYAPKPKDDIEVIERMNFWVEKKRSWGFWKLHKRLKKDGLKVNHKRLHRLYTEAKLNMRRATKRRVPERVKQPLVLPIGPNITWSMDFMSDAFIGGRKYRTFNVMDDFGREALNITIDTSIRAVYVIRELEQLVEWRGKPEKIRVDNGPEFIAGDMEEWAAGLYRAGPPHAERTGGALPPHLSGRCARRLPVREPGPGTRTHQRVHLEL